MFTIIQITRDSDIARFDETFDGFNEATHQELIRNGGSMAIIQTDEEGDVVWSQLMSDRLPLPDGVGGEAIHPELVEFWQETERLIKEEADYIPFHSVTPQQ